MKVNADNAGFDEQRLERITEHIQERYIDAGRIAGAQMAVFRHGQVGYFRSFGARDIERGKPVEEDTIWRIYSMTKPITGVALLSLYERDKHLVYNAAVLLGPDGKLIGKYRKVCLPHGEVEKGVAPGSDYPVFDTKFGKLGLMVCYDGFFPAYRQPVE